MSDMIEQPEPSDPVEATADEPAEPIEPAPPISGRFLFVDVASQRANQLRRGARVRIDDEDGRHVPHKLERVAMEEVRRQLVQYQVPDLPVSRGAD